MGSDEWYYVNTASNPADIAARGLSVEKLIESSWFSGPAFLRDHNLLSVILSSDADFPLELNDLEVKSTCHEMSAQNELPVCKPMESPEAMPHADHSMPISYATLYI